MRYVAQILGLAFFSYFSCFSQELNKADYIFFGGDILTQGKQTDPVEALAVRDGKIMFLGSKKDALYLQGATTQWINLQQGALTPGFINADANLLFQGLSHFCLDLSFKNFQNSSKLKDHIRALAKHGPILAMGFDPHNFKEKNLFSLKFLDSLSLKDPIIILNTTGDIAYVNSKALQMAGISKQDASLHYLKKKDGSFCGIVVGAEYVFKLISVSPIFSTLDLAKILKIGIRDYAKHGYTTIIDRSPASSEQLFKLIQHLVDQTQQIKVFSFAPYSAFEILGKVKNTQPGNFVLAGVNFPLDGFLPSRLASLTIPYKKKQSEGLLFFSHQDLIAKVKKAKLKGLEISFKASGDRAISQAISCCQALQTLNPDSKDKYLITQATLSSQDHLEDMAHLGASPCFSMSDISIWGYTLLRSILPKALIEDFILTNLAFKLDTKCSITSGGVVSHIHPMQVLETALTRKNSRGSVIHRQERLSIDEAMACLSLNPAYMLNQEDKIGSLEVGKQADFVVLSANPKKVGMNKISKIKVIETWIDGSRVNLNLEDPAAFVKNNSSNEAL
jgi:predicted amidohydrolase YtcJ